MEWTKKGKRSAQSRRGWTRIGRNRACSIVSRPPPIVIRSDRSIGRFNNRGPAIRNRYRRRTSCEFSAVINGRTPTRKIATERYTTILRTFACGAITSFGQQCSKIITNLSLSLSRFWQQCRSAQLFRNSRNVGRRLASNDTRRFPTSGASMVLQPSVPPR